MPLLKTGVFNSFDLLRESQLQPWGLLPEHLERLLPKYLRQDGTAHEDHVPVQVARTRIKMGTVGQKAKEQIAIFSEQNLSMLMMLIEC